MKYYVPDQWQADGDCLFPMKLLEIIGGGVISQDCACSFGLVNGRQNCKIAVFLCKTSTVHHHSYYFMYLVFENVDFDDDCAEYPFCMKYDIKKPSVRSGM